MGIADQDAKNKLAQNRWLAEFFKQLTAQFGRDQDNHHGQ